MNNEGHKMNIFKSLLVTLCLFEVNLASLKSCSENQTHQQLCFMGNAGYAKPFPVVLEYIGPEIHQSCGKMVFHPHYKVCKIMGIRFYFLCMCLFVESSTIQLKKCL